MKNKFLILLLIITTIASSSLKAQNTPYNWRGDPFAWQLAFGTEENSEKSGDFCRTSDDNYLLISSSQGLEQTLLYMVKTTLNGEIIWEKTQQIRDFEYTLANYKICEGEEGYYYIGGGYHISNSIPWKPYLIKINNYGDTMWVKTLEGEPLVQYYFNNLIKGNDNSIIATGLFEDYQIIKFNYQGDTVWTLNHRIDRIIAMEDHYIAFEYNTTNNLLFINENGEVYNQIQAPFDITQDVTKTKSGTFLIKGYDINICSGIAKINQLGELIFKNCETNVSNSPIYIQEGLNDNILCLGVYYDGYMATDFRIYLLDENAEYIKDTILYRSELDEIPRGLEITDEGDYILFGWGEEGPIGGSDLILAKMYQWQTTGINEIANNVEVNIFPNPVADIINLNFGEEFTGSYSLFGQTGKIITEGKINYQTQIQIPASNLCAGIYLLNIYNNTNNQIINNKIIKL